MCAPLGVEVASQASVQGDDATVPTGVPSTRNCTVATPEPLSAGFAFSATLGPPTVAPASGAVTEPVGAVLSTRVVTTFDVTACVPSVAIARRS